MAAAFVFSTRMGVDPGFYRFVFSSILRDRDLPSEVLTLLRVILEEWRRGGPVPLKGFSVPATSPLRNTRAASVDARVVRRTLDRDFPHLVDKEPDPDDGRGRRLRTPLSRIPRLFDVEEPPSPRTVDFQLKLVHDLVGVAPESIEWTMRFNELWNQAAGREPRPYFPANEAEDARHEIISVWLTTREVPILWFLRQNAQRRRAILEASLTFKLDDEDIDRLAAAFEVIGREAETAKLVVKGAWALLDIQEPESAARLAAAGLAGRFGANPRFSELHHPAALAELDLNRRFDEAAEHARAYARYCHTRGDAPGVVIAMLCEHDAASRSGNGAARARLIQDILTTVCSIQDTSRRLWAAGNAAYALGRTGDDREAARLLSIAWEAWVELPVPQMKDARRWLEARVTPGKGVGAAKVGERWRAKEKVPQPRKWDDSVSHSI